MTSGRLTLFDSPLFLGFDQLEETFDRLRKSADGYPPYNIEQTGDRALRITLAVAGFTMEDLDIEVEQTQLTIRGRQTDDKSRIYLHRGIAARQFQKAFVLADGLKVKGATLESGLLHIDLERVEPLRKVQKIAITAPEGDSSRSRAIDVQSSEEE